VPLSSSPPESSGRTALRIALVYAVVATAWTAASGAVLHSVGPDAGAALWIHLAQGIGFVAVSAFFLWWWTRRILHGRGLRIERERRAVERRHEAEAERALLLSAMDHAGEAILVTGLDGSILYANRAYCELSGYSTEELIGRNPRIVKSGLHPPSFYREMWETLGAGRTFRGEFRNRHKDGTVYTQNAAISPVTSDEGEVIAFVGVARDVTVDRTLRVQLEHAHRMELVGQMAAGAAHDFRNILGVLRLNGEMALGALEEGGAPVLEGHLHEVLEACTRGEGLVRHLLSFGGEERLELTRRSLPDLVDGFASTLRSVLPDPIELEFVMDPSVPAVRADRGAMEQILLNLVMNARDAMSEGGRVELRIEHSTPDDPWVRLSVSDTGKGMSSESLAKVFAPFFTTKAGKGGTGLGLLMVQALVRRHEGRVSLRSTPDEGTVVEVLLPAVGPDPGTPSEDPPQVEEDPPWAAASATGARVLVVDDDDALLGVISKALTMSGFEVLGARDVSSAIATLEGDGPLPAVVITDVLMPGLSGADLYARALELGLDRPFIFMSGSAVGETPAGGLLGKTVFFLEKPFTVQTLAATVQSALAPAAS